MIRLAFIVPAHKRFDLARVCLRQLRRTCDALDRVYEHWHNDWADVDPITRVTFFCGSGADFAEGTKISLYGIK